jgi:hypothetical protein
MFLRRRDYIISRFRERVIAMKLELEEYLSINQINLICSQLVLDRSMPWVSPLWHKLTASLYLWQCWITQFGTDVRPGAVQLPSDLSDDGGYRQTFVRSFYKGSRVHEGASSLSDMEELFHSRIGFADGHCTIINMRGLRASWSYTKLGKTHAKLPCADPVMTSMASITVTPGNHTDSRQEEFSLLHP